MHSIKKVNKTASNNKTFQQKMEKLIYTLKTRTESAINSITMAGIKTLLNTASITL